MEKAMAGQVWVLGGGSYCPNGIRGDFSQERAYWTIPQSKFLCGANFVLDQFMIDRMNKYPDTIFEIVPLFQWHNENSNGDWNNFGCGFTKIGAVRRVTPKRIIDGKEKP